MLTVKNAFALTKSVIFRLSTVLESESDIVVRRTRWLCVVRTAACWSKQLRSLASSCEKYEILKTRFVSSRVPFLSDFHRNHHDCAEWIGTVCESLSKYALYQERLSLDHFYRNMTTLHSVLCCRKSICHL